MVIRTIEIKEIKFEVPKDRHKEVVSKIKKFYPDLKINVKNENIISVAGDLRNYKKRSNLIYILSGGKHGTNIQAS